ncbi:hypothetical protein [Ruegeria atlantica]|uniref:hypothetical protein n=1 Tax=Ruegeria atlantica TaxID=81569 RepID=UPI00147F8F55|nr:hypothetical protein [Ruegeria atlantica]
MAIDFGKLMPQMADVAFGPVAISGILGVTILLWVTDSWHRIAPAWVGLGAALICALPVVGVIPFSDLPQKVNIAPIFFVSGVIGFGAVVFHSGINAWAGVYLVTMFHEANLSSNTSIFASLAAIGSLVAVCTTVPTAPGVVTPLAGQLAEATAWPVEWVLVAQRKLSWSLSKHSLPVNRKSRS